MESNIRKGSISLHKFCCSFSLLIFFCIPLPSLNEAKILLEAIPGIINVNVDGKMSGWLGLELDDISKRNDSDKYQINNIILNSLISAQIPVISFEAEKGHLRDVFLNLTEEETE